MDYLIKPGNDKTADTPSGNGYDKTLTRLIPKVAGGLEYIHSRVSFNTRKTLESSAFLYSLIELLDEKGLISIAEIDERKKKVAGRLIKKFEESRIGLLYQEPGEDKYTFSKNSDIDCAKYLNSCKAVCCKLPFALSKQDVDERILHWEFGRPYLIAHDGEGYCSHLNQENYKCTAYDHRPLPCRGFSCRENEKWPVWKDFDTKVINSEFEKQVRDSNEKMYHLHL
jgi:Fe-S-cluster containining protein